MTRQTLLALNLRAQEAGTRTGAQQFDFSSAEMRGRSAVVALLALQVSLALALSGSLYTYANYQGVTGIYIIDPATGVHREAIITHLSRTSNTQM